MNLTMPIFDGPALCAEVDPTLFFTNPDDRAAIREARKVCARCEIQAACLKWSLDNDEPAGVWGGLTEKQRQRLLRNRAAA